MKLRDGLLLWGISLVWAAPIPEPQIQEPGLRRLINGLGLGVIVYGGYVFGKGQYDNHKASELNAVVSVETTVTIHSGTTTIPPAPTITSTSSSTFQKYLSVTLDLPQTLTANNSGYEIPSKVTIAVACPYIPGATARPECPETLISETKASSNLVFPNRAVRLPSHLTVIVTSTITETPALPGPVSESATLIPSSTTPAILSSATLALPSSATIASSS